MIFKTSLNFWCDGYGWTEAFYWQGSRQQALQNIGLLAQARSPLLAEGVILLSADASDMHRGKSAVGVGRGASLESRGPPWSAVRCSLVAEGSYRRSCQIRGLPSNFYRGTPEDGQIEPGFLGRLNSYLETLASLNFCLKVLDRAVPRIPIVAIGPDVSELDFWQTGFVELITASPHGLQLLDTDTGQQTRVGVHGVRWSAPVPPWAQINGTQKILALPDATTVFLDNVSVPPDGFYFPGGMLAPRKIAYKAIQRGSVLSPTKRNTGRG